MKRVETYYNLHKHCLSYREAGGKVQHAEAIVLDGVQFAVQPAGRDKVRREKRKVVHAFVRGVPVRVYGPEFDKKDFTSVEDSGMRRITYNPYKYDSFVYADTEEPVFEADRVFIIGRNVYVVPA
jgi:hypothetical protein